MVIIEFFTWWYTLGYARLVRTIGNRLRRTMMTFSVPILIQTLFEPWRRIITYGGGSLQEKAKAVLDNLVSRVVGTIVRLIVIGVALLMALAIIIGGAIAVVLWPLAPFLVVFLVFKGLIG